MAANRGKPALAAGLTTGSDLRNGHPYDARRSQPRSAPPAL